MDWVCCLWPGWHRGDMEVTVNFSEVRVDFGGAKYLRV